MGSEELLGQRASPNWHFCVHAELPFAKAQEGSSGSRHEWAYCEVAQGSFSASSCNHVQQCLSASSSVTRVFRTVLLSHGEVAFCKGARVRHQANLSATELRGSPRVVFRLRQSLVDKGTERWAARSFWANERLRTGISACTQSCLLQRRKKDRVVPGTSGLIAK